MLSLSLEQSFLILVEAVGDLEQLNLACFGQSRMSDKVDVSGKGGPAASAIDGQGMLPIDVLP
jgi:hypothetical protein